VYYVYASVTRVSEESDRVFFLLLFLIALFVDLEHNESHFKDSGVLGFFLSSCLRRSVSYMIGLQHLRLYLYCNIIYFL